MKTLWLFLLLLAGVSSLSAQDRQIAYQQRFNAEFWAEQPIGIVAYTMCGEQPTDTAFSVYRPGLESVSYYEAIKAHEAMHREQAKRFENCFQSLEYYRSSPDHAADQEAEAYAESLKWLKAHGEDVGEWRSKFLIILYNMFSGRESVDILNAMLSRYYPSAQ